MARRPIAVLVIAALSVASAAGPAAAEQVPPLDGPRAIVTLESLPAAPRAGEAIEVRFMAAMLPSLSEVALLSTLRPTFVARHRESGESIQVEARRLEGHSCHFTAEVVFPRAGAWSWEIVPGSIPEAARGALTVRPQPGAERPAFPTGGWLLALGLVLPARLALARRRHVGTVRERVL